jgi:hypothetical protein
MRSRIVVLAALVLLAGFALVDLVAPTASAAECVVIISPDPSIQPIDPCSVLCKLSHQPCIE